jgi:UMF1 family MFS transporter
VGGLPLSEAWAEARYRAEARAWAMYAFANHGWVTTVGTVLIGPWLLALATHNGTDRTVLFRLGPLPLHAEAYPSAVVTASAVLQLFVLPVAGAAADGARSPRRLLMAACLAGSAIAALIATSSGGEWLDAGCLYLLGTLVFGASDIVYNSFLPRIALPHRRDAVSSLGFAYGYAGAGLLLAANLALVELHGPVGISKEAAVRLSFVSAGLWWAGFGTWSLSRLRAEASRRPPHERLRRRLARSAASLRSLPLIRRYLAAYLLFADAISAVIALSSTYITHQLFHDNASQASGFLFALVLMVQFVAVGGSLLFGRLAAMAGAKTAVLCGLGVWCLVIAYAYAELHTKAEAVGLGVAIGAVLGGTQALARSIYSQLVVPGSEATFFGIFEVANQGTSWVAPLLFTVVVDATGSFRLAILSLLVLFAGGGILLAATKLGRPGGVALGSYALTPEDLSSHRPR